MHAWKYGSSAAWRDYTYALAKRLLMSGIRCTRTYEGYRLADGSLVDKTAGWVIRFSESDLATATQIADAIEHYAWKTTR